MKKLPLLATGLIVSLFTGCTINDQSIEDSPIPNETHDIENRNNESEISVIDAEVEVYEFQEAVSKADLIAQVEIMDIIEEVNDPSPKTIYRTIILESLKGRPETSEIYVMQQGNSEYVFNGNALFEQGDKYILFMMETEGLNIEDSYYILGEETGMYKLTDQLTAVKLSVQEDMLEEIEITDLGIAPFSIEDTRHEIQILQQDKLKSLIINVSEEGQQ